MGSGNWLVFNRMPVMQSAAERWSREIVGIERPWLCWNVDPKWCALQQRLVRSVGWTPVVGSDPRCSVPPLIPGAVFVDFNREFRLPAMKFHFVLEFAYLWAGKLAFWHSDLVCRREIMNRLARLFEELSDGEVAAVPETGGRRNWFRRDRHRYWELAGCTTRGASRDQFDRGCGWWRHFDVHVNCPDYQERIRRERLYWDHGVGILYWKRRYGGCVRDIPLKWLEEGHCSKYNGQIYLRQTPNDDRRALGLELTANYQLTDVCRRLGLADLVESIAAFAAPKQ